MPEPEFSAPSEFQRFLGKTFVDRLGEVALQIGKDTWSRHDLADALGCGNYRAASLVTRALRKLQVKNIKEVFSYDPVALAGIHSLGETGMWVLIRALESRGYDTTIWCGLDKDGIVTFRTLKLRQQKRVRRRRKK